MNMGGGSVDRWTPHTRLGVTGGDIRQKLEFHHTHLELGALGYIETFLFYWSWGFCQKKTTMADFRF